MKQITHKDVLKSFNNIIEYFKDDDFEGKTTLDEIIVMEFIRQQEKKDKLLELYRKHMNTLCKKDREGVKNSLFSSEFVAYEVYQQIKALEEELK